MAASIGERLRLRVLHLGFLVTRPMSLGVRGIVINSDDEVMLVRHGYVSGWHFPGGGVEVGETCVESVTRELEEEALHRAGSAAGPARALLQHANVEARPRRRLCGPKLPGLGRAHAELGNPRSPFFSTRRASGRDDEGHSSEACGDLRFRADFRPLVRAAGS